MGIVVRTNISELQELDNSENLLLNNLIKGFNTADFKVDNIDVKKLILSNDQSETSLSNSISLDFGNTFFNIFEHTSISKDKCTFIHICCMKKVISPLDISIPIKFNIKLEGVDLSLGSFSQFQLLDIKNLNYNLIIQDIVLKADEKANLLIIIGGKE